MFCKKQILGVALATFVAASLTACGSGEEKETRAMPSELKAQQGDGVSVVAPKSYVRERKAGALPPFIAVGSAKEGNHGMTAVLTENQNRKDIVDVTVNNGKCDVDKNLGEDTSDLGIALGFKYCDVKEVELITKSSGKVTYKF